MVSVRTTVSNRLDYDVYRAVRVINYSDYTVDSIELSFKSKPVTFEEIPPAVTVDEVCHVPYEEDIELLDVEWING